MVLERKLDCIPEVHPGVIIKDTTSSGSFKLEPEHLLREAYERKDKAIYDNDEFWVEFKDALARNLSYHPSRYLSKSERKDFIAIAQDQADRTRSIWLAERKVIDDGDHKHYYVESRHRSPLVHQIPDEKITLLDKDNWAYDEMRRIKNGSNPRDYRLSHLEMERVWLSKMTNPKDALMVIGANHVRDQSSRLVTGLIGHGYVLNPLLDLSELDHRIGENFKSLHDYQKLISFRESLERK